MTFKQAALKVNNKTKTTNGAKAFKSTLDAHVDLFSRVGALRSSPNQALTLFSKAFDADVEKALRILLWSRDVRGGAGERNIPRLILKHLSKESPETLENSDVLFRMTEVGRWDDILVLLEGSKLQKTGYAFRVIPGCSPVIHGKVIGLIRQALADGNGLCAKWMPRKGDIAAILRHELGWTPKQYRKTLVNLTNVVETQMCRGEFDQINFSHVPSQAMSKYMTAFWRNAPAQMQEFKNKVEKGEVKINATTLYPHQCYIDIKRGKDEGTVNAMWEALPDYIGGEHKILPMIDVSGSMSCSAGGTSVECIDVAVGLGLYCADRTKGAFHNMFLTFSSRPSIQVVTGKKLSTKMSAINRADWGMSTNINAAFNEILKVAKKGNVAAEDMPTHLLILSDMQFDRCANLTGYDMLKKSYKEAGYEIPKVVFWNLNASTGNSPCKSSKEGVALVSGFSPAIMKAVLSDNFERFTPENVMLETIMQDKYDPNIKAA